MTYFLQLGRLADLSRYELEQLLPNVKLGYVTEHVVSVEVEPEVLSAQLEKSGGVIKAMEVLQDDQKMTREEVIENATAILSSQEKITFALTEFIRPNQQKVVQLQEIKNALKKFGKSSRFIESGQDGLSASILLHQDVTELNIFYLESATVIAKTIWVQNIDDWTIRDREKPKRDPKRGMLPPKLARMMINFVSPEIQNQENKVLYDPFCGSGTILMEGMMVGWEVIGSDLSTEALHDSATNLHWFSDKYQKPELKSLFIKDATQTSIQDLKEKVDAIVTEPFLGKQTPNPRELPNVFKGLEKMYWGALKNWTKILKEGGEVVIVTPLVTGRKTDFSLEKIIDKSTTLGYNVVSGPLIYNREQTTVQRAIYKLKYK